MKTVLQLHYKYYNVTISFSFVDTEFSFEFP